ncbi:alpha-E domain-containing protein [Leucothrix arctica]|uniref:DUF403 domain-containing protein n=1 Tax=Leucothrix arctica TaxID=1481894 RepID=A0A317C4N5_9GAMM|nr:alpha-E domain-containing protein [Leucothrix arctica]PWQ93161.1 hypothetical protein DKT75_20955 [Leucothrix arctica]
MLSRNAERTYWLGRYVERTEDTARLLNAFTHVMMDIPSSGKLGWDVLLKIMASEELFYESYDKATESNVIKFLLCDEENPSSIRSAVKAARENARTLRDRLPAEAWEMLNDLNLFLKKGAEEALHQRNRFQFLKDTVSKCQRFNGMVRTTLSRTQVYEFLILGACIERADMTTRLLDVAAGVLLSRADNLRTFDNHIWLEILKAHNAVMMYRMVNGPMISPKPVLSFLIGEDEFPRSIKHCLDSTKSLAENLPRNETFIKNIDALISNLDSYKQHGKVQLEDLSEFFDETQQGINELHQIIATTWFLSAVAPEQTQTQTEV